MCASVRVGERVDTVSSPSPAAGQLAAVSATAAATAATTAAAATAAAAATTACLGKQKEKTSTNMAQRSLCDYNRGLQHFTRAGPYKLPEA